MSYKIWRREVWFQIQTFQNTRCLRFLPWGGKKQVAPKRLYLSTKLQTLASHNVFHFLIILRRKHMTAESAVL